MLNDMTAMASQWKNWDPKKLSFSHLQTLLKKCKSSNGIANEPPICDSYSDTSVWQPAVDSA